MGINAVSRIFDWFRDPENKKFTLVLLVLFCLLLEETIHLYWGIEVAYTHVFYILLVLAAIWYHERAVFLAIVHRGNAYRGQLRGIRSTDMASAPPCHDVYPCNGHRCGYLFNKG